MHFVIMCSTDLYLVNGGTVTPDLFITVNGSLSMTLTATLQNDTNISEVFRYVYQNMLLIL